MADFDTGAAINAASAKWGVDPLLANAISQQGEGYGSYPATTARSDAGAFGPMQLMPATAKGLNVDPTDPAQNVDGGVRLIKQFSDRYGGDPALIAAAYNAGPGAVDAHNGVPPYKETQAYVARVQAALNPVGVSQSDIASAAADYAAGVRQVTPSPAGGVTDPATGTQYRPDPDHPGQYLDPTNAGYTIASPEDVKAAADAYVADRAKNPPAPLPGDAPVTVGGLLKQGLGAVGDFANGIVGSLSGRPEEDADAAAYGDLLDPKGAAMRAQVTAKMADQPNPQLPALAPPPANFPERFVRYTTPLALGAFAGPEGEAGALANAAFRAKNVVYPAITATLAGEATNAVNGSPDETSAAYALGSLPGAVAAIPNALTGLADATTGFLKPFVANVSKVAREKQAGQILANSASDYTGATHALSGYEPIVPNSPATVGDASGDLGLINLSRSVTTKNPGDYAALTTQQAEARAAHLNTLQTGASPMQAQQHIRATLDDLDAQTQAGVDAAVANAQAKSAAIGGVGTPEDYGSQVRGATKEALDASKANVKGLYDAVDPDGTLTGNVATTRLAARNIVANVSPLATPMNAAETRIFGQVAALPNVVPLKDITALKASINEAATDAVRDGNQAAYSRLSGLRGALNENLSTTIADAAAKPEISSRVGAWIDGRSQPNSAVASGSAGGAGPADSQLGGSGSTAPAGGGGATLQTGGGPGGVAGAPIVSGAISPELKPVVMGGQTVGYQTPTGETISAANARSWQGSAPATPTTPPSVNPTIDADARARLATADSAYATQAQTFDAKPVGPTLQTNGYVGQYGMKDGKVPAQFFHPGPTGYTDMAAIAKASPEALPAIQDYAAATLRNTAVDPNTGVLDPAKFAKWRAQYADSIRALPPEVQAKFADAASAGQAVADATTARKAALASAQSGAIGKIMGAQSPEEVTSHIGTILGSPTRVSDMQTLVNATASNPDALAGLKQAVIDHISGRYISNAEAGASGTNKIAADQFQTFMRNAGPALAKVLAPDEMGRLQAIAADIQQSQRTLNATRLPGQSNTMQDAYAGGMPKAGGTVTRTLLDALSATLSGSAALAGHLPIVAPIASAAGVGMSEMVQGLRTAGINKVGDLVREAVFNPQLAAALMQRVTGPQELSTRSNVGRALMRAVVGPTAATASAQPKETPLPESYAGTALRGMPPPDDEPRARGALHSFTGPWGSPGMPAHP